MTPYSLVLLLLLTGALLVMVMLHRKSGPSRPRRLERQAVIRRASGVWFLGLESEAGGAVRGPGSLTLARDGLHFQVRSERRELFIPGSAVVYLGSGSSFREQALEREALIVHYLSPQGRQEEAGFLVPAAGRWVAAFKAGLPARDHGRSQKSQGNRP